MDKVEETKIETEDDVKIAEVVPKRGRGRPKTKIEEPKIPKRRGPKTDASKHKEYYSQCYRDRYKNNYTQCPNCWKPVQKCQITRHMRSEHCFRDQMSKKYINTNVEQYIEKNKEEFDKFCNLLIENPDLVFNPRIK